MVTIGLAVILSGSRAGILALTVICLIELFQLLRISTKQKILIGILLSILLSGLYFVKKDSADGRLLIWQCSWEMIKDKPFTGHGTGGFKAGYMNYQAKYFEENPDSKYVMIADSTNRPFNEYIGLLVNYGLAGFLLFLLFLFYLIRTYWRNTSKTPLTRIACRCLTAIAIFAFFSYPLWYPFVWIILLLSVSIIISENPCYPRRLCSIKKIIPVLILILAPVVCIKSYNRLKAEMEWCEVAHKSLAGKTQQMLPEYQSLHTKLYDNELFLYNYAAELHVAGYFGESLSIARECERLWADYDLQMLMAENYLQMKNYAKAEQHYQKAAAMCPVKFIPLYCLYQLYGTTGDRENEMIMAEKILYKPVKVTSPVIQQMKEEVEENLRITNYEL